jgi:hypothetical protein
MLSYHWQKSSLSSGGDNCVEARLTDDRRVQVRNSKDPHGATASFSEDEWTAFLRGVVRGEFGIG